jgi:hypothetical protein
MGTCLQLPTPPRDLGNHLGGLPSRLVSISRQLGVGVAPESGRARCSPANGEFVPGPRLQVRGRETATETDLDVDLPLRRVSQPNFAWAPHARRTGRNGGSQKAKRDAQRHTLRAGRKQQYRFAMKSGVAWPALPSGKLEHALVTPAVHLGTV